jgi:hypothetical protein
MDAPKEVEITNVQHTYRFPRAGAPIQITRYTYYVGNLGPFYIEALANEDNADHINKVLNDQVLNLRATGAIQ